MGKAERSARATATVSVAGGRAGSGALVGHRHLLTAGHVLRRMVRGDYVLADAADVSFPFMGCSGSQPLPARRIALGAGADALDVAVLELEDPLPDWLPKPVPVWPARRLPDAVAVFGFPKVEPTARGVWREFTVAGPVAGGGIQADWAGAVGTLVGHSGGPVFDAESGALVGVLVEGSEAGRFDRFVPVGAVAACWDRMPRPWLFAGGNGRGHFERRARGQVLRARGGDLFRGRAPAVEAVQRWLVDETDQGRPLVVTGQPGAGTSAVVARAALALESDGDGPGLAFHARSATHVDFLRAVADLVGVDVPSTRDALLDSLAGLGATAQPAGRRWPVVVDGLYEAASAEDRHELATTLAELSVLPDFRIAVATRPMACPDRFALGSLLNRLGVSRTDDAALVDLDSDTYFDVQGLQELAGALLAQEGADHPGPPGAAWTAYRANSCLRHRLSTVIAQRAGRNYLVAAMTAEQMSRAREPVDPDADGFDPGSIPSHLGDALRASLERLATHERAVLSVLAYARGSGVSDRLWLSFAAALGYAATVEDLDRLRASPAVDLLLRSTDDSAGSGTGLFHQALNDEILRGRPDRRSDERGLFRLCQADVEAAGGWAKADHYWRLHAAVHAKAAGELESLIEDVAYLAVADLTRLLPHLAAAASPSVSPMAALVRQVGLRADVLPPARRLRLLALTAAQHGMDELTSRLAAGVDDGVVPRWAHGVGPLHQELSGHTGAVRAVALGTLAGRAIIVSGSTDMTLRVWDAVSGTSLGGALRGHTGEVRAVVLRKTPERTLIYSGGDDDLIRVWDLSTGKPWGTPFAGHGGLVSSLAVGRTGSRDVLVSGGSDRTVRLWDADTGTPLGPPLTGHECPVQAVAIGAAGGRNVVASAADDGTVRVWDAATGEQLGAPLNASAGPLRAVALGRYGELDVVVAGADDRVVRMWDVASRRLVKQSSGHTDAVWGVSLGSVGGQDVVVSAGDTRVRVWVPGMGGLVDRRLAGHTSAVMCVAIGRVADRDVIVSGGADWTVRVWDAATARPMRETLNGHEGWVLSAAHGTVQGHEALATGGDDGTVVLWDADSGAQVDRFWDLHSVTAVALGHANDADLLASGTQTGDVSLWDAATAQAPWDPPIGNHRDAVTSLAVGDAAGRGVVVSGSLDHTIRINGVAIRETPNWPAPWHPKAVHAVALGSVDGRDVVVSGGEDSCLDVWDVATGEHLGRRLEGHLLPVHAVAFGELRGRPAIVSGSADNRVNVWDPASHAAVKGVHTGAPVQAVAIGRSGGRDVVLWGGADATACLWDVEGDTVVVLDLPGPCLFVALGANDRVYALTSVGLCAFQGGGER